MTSDPAPVESDSVQSVTPQGNSPLQRAMNQYSLSRCRDSALEQPMKTALLLVPLALAKFATTILDSAGLLIVISELMNMCADSNELEIAHEWRDLGGSLSSYDTEILFGIPALLGSPSPKLVFVAYGRSTPALLMDMRCVPKINRFPIRRKCRPGSSEGQDSLSFETNTWNDSVGKVVGRKFT
ncbi:hypothetical protein B0H19DRAFT_1073982 [Mycena capillaripes]|nr:hypothetical protein B0H19DRAFT_1073982 [Mycena capillaripes]